MSLPPVFDKLALPLIGAPLFIISNPKLVIAQCTAGIVGSMPALNARPASQLDEWLAWRERTVQDLRAERRDLGLREKSDEEQAADMDAMDAGEGKVIEEIVEEILEESEEVLA